MSARQPVYASAGEALIDLIQGVDGRYEACLGGSVFNFSVAMARQGVASAYANPLSVDAFGRRFRQRLQEDGVAILSEAAVPQPTSLAVVSLDAQGKASYTFHRSDVADRSYDELVLSAALRGATALHVGGLSLVPQDVERTIVLMQSVAASNGVISVDANMRPAVVRDHLAYVAAVKRAMAHGHYLKLSDEDLVHLGYVVVDAPFEAHVSAARHVLAQYPQARLVALTLGARGAALIQRGLAVQARPPEALPVVDTVGAGDCFMAATMAHLLRHGQLTQVEPELGPLADALAHGIAAASINCSRVGCDPANWDETAELATRVRVLEL